MTEVTPRWTAEQMDDAASVQWDARTPSMLKQAAESERTVARVREWTTEPLGTEQQIAEALVDGLGLIQEYADIASVVALKAIQDCRGAVAALLAPETKGTR